jgi:UDP-N-acetyl-D-mannosaminuronic acid dehydrogenase
MPEHVLNRIDHILRDIAGSKKVTILGITYKPNVDDTRESPILKLIDLLEARKDYDISVYDPYVKTHKYQAKDLIDASKDSDLIVLGVNHDIFKDLPLEDMGLVMRNKNLFDTRNFLDRYVAEEKGLLETFKI